METILISACLVGDKVRYNGKGNYNPLIEKIKDKYDLVLICPEVMGGLSVPRDQSEILKDSVITSSGKDVSSYFNKGALIAKNLANYTNARKAILVDNSPSCGVHNIHNGKFDDVLIKGEGVTTRLLKHYGVTCYTLEEFVEEFITN